MGFKTKKIFITVMIHSLIIIGGMCVNAIVVSKNVKVYFIVLCSVVLQ